METSDKYARRKVIEEVAKRWIKKNPETLKTFASTVKSMRQAKPYENQAHTYRATVPGDLMRQLEFAVQATDDARLFDPEGELQWFCDNFPEFTIPYDKTSIER